MLTKQLRELERQADVIEQNKQNSANQLFKGFICEIYPTNGEYQVHIRNERTSHHNWNYERLVAEYPIEIAMLKSIGIDNKSRDLYGKGLGIPRTFPTLKSARVAKAAYDTILNYFKSK